MSSSSLFDLGPERLNRLLSLGKEGPEADADPAVEAPAAAPESDSATEQPGSWIGPYRLVRMLGEGGMGAVYLAEQEHPIQRQVALKVIKPGMDTKRVIARFEAERQVLALLDHPHIAHVFNAGRTKAGRPYFVMEYVQGLPITDYCDRQKLTIEERLRLFQHVCEAIHHAHQKGIIHRDIKASNVLVSRQDGHDVPKVIDFGVAKAMGRTLTEHTFSTEDSQLLGTPEYMSPEQADMVKEDIDVRSDVYSLGVLLYVLLAGVLPFDSDAVRSGGIEQLRRVIRDEDPVSPSTRLTRLQEGTARISENRRTDVVGLRRTLRQELEWIPLKAIQKKREWRYQSVAELGADTDNYLHGKPLLAGPPSKLYSARKFMRRHRFAVLAGASIAALALVAIVVLSLSTIIITRQKHQTQAALTREEQARSQERQVRQEAIQQRDIAYRNRYVAQIRLASEYRGAAEVTACKPMLEEYIPEPGEPDLRGWEWYYLLSRCCRDLITLSGHDARVVAVRWSPNGRFLASCDADGTIRVWDPVSRESLSTLAGRRGEITVDWGPDSQSIATLIPGQRIRVRGVATGDELLEFGALVRPVAAAWSRDAGLLAAIAQDRRVIAIWDTTTGRQIAEFTDASGGFSRISFSPDGERLAVAKTPDHEMSIWAVATGQEVQTWSAHDNKILTINWSPDGTRIATGGFDFSIRTWEAATGRQTLSVPVPPLQECAWSPDGTRIVAASDRRRVFLWDVGAEPQVLGLGGHTGAVNTVAWSPDGRRIASGADDGLIKIWNMHSDSGARILEHPGAECARWNPQGGLLASAGGGEIRLWDLTGNEPIRSWSYDGQDDMWIVWSPNGKYLASGTWGQASHPVIVWNAETGEVSYTAPDGSRMTWSPDGGRLAIAQDTTVQIWDMSTRETALSLVGHNSDVRSVGWSPDGRQVWTATQDGMVKMWDAESAQEVYRLFGHPRFNAVMALAWSADGKRVATAGGYETVRVWDAAQRREIFCLEGHAGEIRDVAWSPDGARLASAGVDATARVWDVHTGRQLLTLAGHTETVRSVAWSQDGRRVATASTDGTVRIWDASVGYDILSEPAYVQERTQRYCFRATELARSRRYQDAAETFTKALDLDPRCYKALSHLMHVAWVQATSRNPQFRNGAEAIRHATRVCEMTNWADPMALETLAAACAEIAAFDQAVQWQQKALSLSLGARDGLRAEMKARLQLYATGRPYHQQPLFPDRLVAGLTDQGVIEPVDPGTTGLVASYSMENDARDGSGHGYDGLLFGKPNFIEGLEGMAVLLDGVDDYIELPIGEVIAGLNECALSIWVNWSARGRVWQRFFDFGNGRNAYMFLTAAWDGGGKPSFAMLLTSRDGEDGTSAPEELTRGWHHLAVTIDPGNTTQSFYLDGKLVGRHSIAQYAPRSLGVTSQNWLGRSQFVNDPYFDGALDEFRIYERVLSAGEILYLARHRKEVIAVEKP